MRLATLNLLNGTSLEDRSVTPGRLVEAVQALRADVVGLQEVDRGQPRSHGADLTASVAEAMGAQHWRFVPALVGTPGGQWRAATDDDAGTTEPAYGIGLVSRWPVRSWHVVRLPAAPVRSPVVLPGTRQLIWLQDEPRVGLAAVVDAPGGPITVATTHLSFVPVWNGTQLRRLVAELGRLPGPRVLLGDLNMPPPFPRLLSRWRVLARTATYPAWEPRIQLDHVLASGDLPRSGPSSARGWPCRTTAPCWSSSAGPPAEALAAWEGGAVEVTARPDERLHLRGPVLVGPDEEVAEAWVVGGRITYERPQGSATALTGWVVPGLVDAHCHVGLDAHGAVEPEVSEQQATADRDAGALLLRDAGSAADTRWVDDREDLPVLVRAGRHIARPRRYIRDFAAEVEPEDLVDEVRRQARRGDGWVKLVGDWIDRDAGDLAPCWPAEALGPAIAAAHEEGARVTAHCFSASSLPDLVEAGIDCIEHATGLDEATLPLLVERGVAVVPTLINIDTFPRIAATAEERFPVYAAHMRALHERRYATVAAAFEAGLPVYAGTDAGGALAHGRIADEVGELHRAGLPAAQALSAACWGARGWLRHPVLEEGAQADLLVLDADPRQDLRVLQAPRAVVLRGRRVR